MNPRRFNLPAALPDRVVLITVQYHCTLFREIVIPDSYAIKGKKGTQPRVGTAVLSSRGDYYVLQGDVNNFFSSIDHAFARNTEKDAAH